MSIKDFIIAENENWVALNKPSGLLSIPDRMGKDVSLKSLLIEKYKDIYTVHRLDKDTSGLIVFAKNLTTHKHLSLQFEERQTKKIFSAICCQNRWYFYRKMESAQYKCRQSEVLFFGFGRQPQR